MATVGQREAANSVAGGVQTRGGEGRGVSVLQVQVLVLSGPELLPTCVHYDHSLFFFSLRTHEMPVGGDGVGCECHTRDIHNKEIIQRVPKSNIAVPASQVSRRGSLTLFISPLPSGT